MSQFGFLENEWPLLARLGELVEYEFHESPGDAAADLERWMQTVAAILFAHEGLQETEVHALAGKINILSGKGIIPETMAPLFHEVRRQSERTQRAKGDSPSSLTITLKLAHRAHKLKPDSGYITDTVAWVYYKKGDYKTAVKYLEQAIGQVPDDPIIREHLGDAYLKVGQYPKALEAYLKAKELGPEDKARLEKKIEDLKKLIK